MTVLTFSTRGTIGLVRASFEFPDRWLQLKHLGNKSGIFVFSLNGVLFRAVSSFFHSFDIINDKNIEKGFKNIMHTPNSNDVLMGSCDPAKLKLKTAQMGVDPCLNLPVSKVCVL